jgi:G3E family GTPase
VTGAAAGSRRHGPVPVTILTGALGAGKTTLLNAALRGVLRNVAVVVNEFGAIGIDHDLIRAATEDVVLLPGGCVCCQVRADLAVALLQLERGAAQGEIPAFERVVVETSGLAEPGPILQLFAESPALAGRFRVDALVCVVDAQQGAAALAEESSAARQALLADRLLVSKSELVSPGHLAQLEGRLAALNPQAEVLRAPRGVAEAAWFDTAPLAGAREVPAALLRAAHDNAVESFVLRWTSVQPMAALGAWLQGLADTHGARLLRAKGIVAADGVAGAVALHVVGHLVAPPEFLPRRVDESRVVLITRGLEPGDVAPPWPFAAARVVAPRAPAMPIPPLPPAAGASCA